MAFVDYNKRGVGLPHGCKDLIDVLNRSRVKRTPPFDPFISGGMQHIEEQLMRLLSSPCESEGSGLLIMCDQFAFQLCCKVPAGPLELFLVARSDEVDREQTIREFFGQRAIRPTQDHFYWGSRIFRYPLPCQAGQASDLIIDLLKTVYHVSEEARFQFMLAD